MEVEESFSWLQEKRTHSEVKQEEEGNSQKRNSLPLIDRKIEKLHGEERKRGLCRRAKTVF